jgi:predicted phosphate transport protein (TIGR00153 family)
MRAPAPTSALAAQYCGPHEQRRGVRERARLSFLRRNGDASVMVLVEEAGRNVQRCGLLLRDLLGDYPEHATVANDVKVCEQEGDRITHDIIHQLATGRGSAPFTAGDGHALATALDDIVDHSEHVAAQLGLYRVEAPMEQAVEFADVLVGAGEQIAQALRCLRTGSELGPHLVEIHRLENEGDRMLRVAIGDLFSGERDASELVKWKDIYDLLEATMDACEHAANVMETIAIKNA